MPLAKSTGIAAVESIDERRNACSKPTSSSVSVDEGLQVQLREVKLKLKVKLRLRTVHHGIALSTQHEAGTASCCNIFHIFFVGRPVLCDQIGLQIEHSAADRHRRRPCMRCSRSLNSTDHTDCSA